MNNKVDPLFPEGISPTNPSLSLTLGEMNEQIRIPVCVSTCVHKKYLPAHLLEGLV